MKRRATIFALALIACTAAQAKRLAVPDENAATLKASALIEKYELTSDKIECLDFQITDEGKDFLIQVRENHTPACGGDPNFAPTLFFMKIRKSDGRALTDDYDAETFQPLRKPKH
ncbi:hypothetical protein [Paraburkholderia megapolitana]|uniref:Uncharacterized protein n=1 Tax=Paraburkholderia megapolitana TaxID=420953 RepID=A0A1I3RSF7_9BURK|nr:hypothetical protein [Paraburkholderia megapolitana]QDQ84034.1 hypothetical protein FNZ07_23160 [Paraburkholderia megapolitana]SFJ49483.1 hypothetical protein SAMN05192543_107419 [Paraburkholderia megapolitana]